MSFSIINVPVPQTTQDLINATLTNYSTTAQEATIINNAISAAITNANINTIVNNSVEQLSFTTTGEIEAFVNLNMQNYDINNVNNAHITTGTIATINATTGTIATLNSNVANVTTANIVTCDNTTTNTTNLNATGTVTIATLNATNNTLTNANISALTVSGTSNLGLVNLVTENVTTGNITTGNITTINSSGTSTLNNVVASTLNATTATIPTLNATVANIPTINGTTATFITETATNMTVTGTANLATISSTNATITNENISNSTIGTAIITNLQPTSIYSGSTELMSFATGGTTLYKDILANGQNTTGLNNITSANGTITTLGSTTGTIATANITQANITTSTISGNETIGGNATVSGNLTAQNIYNGVVEMMSFGPTGTTLNSDVLANNKNITGALNITSTNGTITTLGSTTGTIATANITQANITTATISDDETVGGTLNVTGVATLPTIKASIIEDNNGANVLTINPVASAVNYVTLTNAITANDPIISANGTDTNLDLQVKGKGTGGLYMFGRTDGLTVPSGCIGEIRTSNASTNVTNNTVSNITSITLTAGSWKVFGYVYCSGASLNNVVCSISNVSNTLATQLYLRAINTNSVSNPVTMSCPPQYFNVSASTTIYLVSQLVGTGTLNGNGIITAQRIS